MTNTLLDDAQACQKSDPRRAESLYKQILQASSPSSSSHEQDATRAREQEVTLIKLGEIYRDEQNAEGLAEVILLSRSFMASSTAKAKTAKLIRTLLSHFNQIPNSVPVQTRVLTDAIGWAKQERRIFLKQSLETRLVSLYLTQQQYKPAIALIDVLLGELKRLDDKLVLTEVHLLESKVYRGIGNLPKAKAALTSARTAANAIYCPPYLQAALDLQSGILHAEDKDYTTAYSYFYETFEMLGSQEGTGGETETANLPEGGALTALKYMLLCKIMLNLPEDLPGLLSLKFATKYAQSPDVESMRVVARAHQNRNLREFEKALRDYRDALELSSDPTIRSHLAALYDTLLEQNLLRIVEPYSVVEVDFVARTVGQERQGVEAKLSQMILDKTLNGVLDQGRGCLLIFDEPEGAGTYGAAIEMLEQIGNVVGSLYAKTTKIA